MEQRLTICIHPQDNVAVAVADLPTGSAIGSGVVTRDRPTRSRWRISPPGGRSSATGS